jgi:competence protein ComEC
VHPKWATIAAMLVVVLYAMIVVPGTPAVRATVLFLAFGIARLVQRRTAHLQLLALCAMGILIAEPQELSSAGFQLSFVTVAGLIIGAQPMATFLTGLVEDEHDRVARSFRPPGFWGSLGLEMRNFLINGLAMSLVAWLVSMPLILIHFQQVNLWGLLAGLILLPLVAVVLIGGLLKILLTLIMPGLAVQWATIASAPLSLLKHVVHGLAHLPGAELVAIQPSPLWVAAGYALLLLPLLPWAWPTVKRYSRCSPVMAVLVICLPAILGTGHPDSVAEARVTLLSIGAGQIGIIELPNHDVFLVDDGSTTVTDPLHRCLAPYLQTRGIRTIQAIFLSHPDYDHISAAAATAQMFHASHVYINPVFREQSLGNTTATLMLRQLSYAHIPIEITYRGQHIPLSSDATIDVLWPPDHRHFTTTNNAGLVLKLTYHGRSALFPADIQTPTEEELLSDKTPLHADVLIAPHHGSAEVSTSAFIAAVHPSIVLSSNAKRLSRKQHEFDRETTNLPVYRTSSYGAVTVHIGPTGELTTETFLHPTP